MNYLKLLVATLLVLTIAACSDPKIDASSDQSMKQSVEKVRASLPEADRPQFDEAMRALAFSQIKMKDLFAEGAAGVGNIEGKVRQSLDGKTGQEVIAKAEQMKAERRQRERKQALEEIRELEAKKDKSQEAREKLKKFEVIRSRFYMKQRRLTGEQPIIELTVKNGTSSAVSRAYFKGTLASPDRSVPWHQDTFNHSISGGIEPDERATWSLAPNMFSDWGNIDAPADAVFTVTVERLDGPDGEAIYSTREFSEHNKKRLKELKQEYGAK